MTLKKPLAVMAAAVLAGSLLSAPAVAQGNTGFAALKGIDAQALSADEMQAVQGMINGSNIIALTAYITYDPNLTADARNLLLASWAKLAKLDGTKYEFLADAFYVFMQKYKYPTMCGLNADFCTGPFPGTW